MNELLMELETAAPWLCRAPRLPGAVAELSCAPTRTGKLLFTWQPPRGGLLVDGYRIERTRDGRDYEPLAETETKNWVLPPVSFNDGWFYRVTAFNARGQGPARWVFFYLRRRRDSIFVSVPVKPGLRVNISELVPE